MCKAILGQDKISIEELSERGQGVGRKNTASDTRKILASGLCVGIFFRVTAMALAILHNVIIGLFCFGIVAYKRGGKVL